ncbi:hypothetical protein ACN38_g11159 [Penicillium nordicum]|uniref:Uncharacterized protein n=1 Tax=Penicillium nordicum TaxID=229535 RepID=A0A0M8NZ93_9EURO|nr:hypothetical protein ACN38_g11159 [Penicillium nordicum]
MRGRFSYTRVLRLKQKHLQPLSLSLSLHPIHLNFFTSHLPPSPLTFFPFLLLLFPPPSPPLSLNCIFPIHLSSPLLNPRFCRFPPPHQFLHFFSTVRISRPHGLKETYSANLVT